MKKFWIVLFVFVLLLSACDGAGEGIEVHDPWASPAAKGENGALYFILHNHSAVDDELIGASSDIAESLEFHETKMENSVAEMATLSFVPIPSDGEVDFAPLGLHIMLANLKRDLSVGDSIEVILHFKTHEDIIMAVPVLEFAEVHDHEDQP